MICLRNFACRHLRNSDGLGIIEHYAFEQASCCTRDAPNYRPGKAFRILAPLAHRVVDSAETCEAAMRRRDFIGGVLSSATVSPLPALAQQQGGRVRLIGALTGIADDSETKARYAAFRQELQRLGWIDGQNVRIDARFGEGDASRIRKQAAELVALSPDVILTTGGQATELALQATRTIPIVFAIVPDPVGSGFVESLAEPGGNATGLAQFEYSLSAKWPELLKEIAPTVKRLAVIWDPTITAGIGQFAVIQSVAPSLNQRAWRH